MMAWNTSRLSTREIPCPLCLSQKFSRQGQVNGYTIARCQACGLSMLNPQPRPDDLFRFYNEAYYSPPESIRFVEKEQIEKEATGKEAAFSQVLESLLQSGAGKRLLDVGCAFGPFLLLAERYGFRATGVEYNRLVAAQARTFGLNVVAGDFLTVDLPTNHFDVVTMWYVLEHLSDPIATLRRAHELLVDRGILFIRVPNMTFGLPFLWMGRLGIERYPSIFSHIPAHLFFYRPETLKQLSMAAGFDLLKVETGVPILSHSDDAWSQCANLARLLLARVAGLVACLTKGRLFFCPFISFYARKVSR